MCRPVLPVQCLTYVSLNGGSEVAAASSESVSRSQRQHEAEKTQPTNHLTRVAPTTPPHPTDPC
jgi:hypothetical protein